jgi:Phage tail sheath protein subtilisin-like domain
MPILDIKAPGTYVTEIPSGINNIDLTSFNACYMFGFAAGGTVTQKDIAVKIDSPADFLTKMGASSTSEKSVDAYFANAAQGYGGGSAGVLYFVNVTRVGTGAVGPTAPEYATSLGKVFDPYMPKGTLICPAGFEGLTAQADRVILANAMRDQAEKFNLIAIADSGPSGAINNYATVNVEQALITSGKGHICYYAGYLKDYQNRNVPSSAFIAGIDNRVNRQVGIAQPPAGTTYTVRGAADVLIPFTNSDQEVLNPAGCNVIRNIYGKGIVVWGARTKSNQVRTQFFHERKILNVLESTLEKAFDEYLFQSIGSQGELLGRVGDSIRDVCHRLWRQGALFGKEPNQAYGVICDMNNNTSSDLQNGIVQAEVYLALTPIMERLFIGVRPTALGQVELAISIVSGTGNTNDEKLVQPNEKVTP